MEAVYTPATRELAQRRKALAPETHDAFQAFSKQVFAAGALDEKTKQLIAVAVAHVTQCPYCIRGHTKAAMGKGADRGRVDGSDLGRGGDAGRRRVRPLCARARCGGQHRPAGDADRVAGAQR